MGHGGGLAWREVVPRTTAEPSALVFAAAGTLGKKTARSTSTVHLAVGLNFRASKVDFQRFGNRFYLFKKAILAL